MFSVGFMSLDKTQREKNQDDTGQKRLKQSQDQDRIAEFQE